MATNQPYLKATNAWWLRLFLAVNIAVFLAVIIGQELTEASIDYFWQRLSAKDGLLAVCIPLAAVVLNGVVGDLGKARLVFWRWSNPLPGCHAFTSIMPMDPRIDQAGLRVRVDPLPTEP